MRRCVESLVLRLEYDAVLELMRQETLAQRWVSTRPVTASSASVRDYMEMRKSTYLAAGKCSTGLEHIFASVDLICNYLGNSLDTCVLPLGSRQLERAVDTTLRKYTVENENSIVKLGGARDKDYIEVNASGKFNILTYAPVYDHVFGETMENPMFRVSGSASYFVMPRTYSKSSINGDFLDAKGIKIIDHNTHRYTQITPNDINSAGIFLVDRTINGNGTSTYTKSTVALTCNTQSTAYEIVVVRPFMLLGTGSAIFAKSGGAAGASWYKMTAIESGTDFSGGFQRVQCVAYTKCWIYDPSMVLTVPDCVPLSIRNGCGTRFMPEGAYDPHEVMTNERSGDLIIMLVDRDLYRGNRDMPLALTQAAKLSFEDYHSILMNNITDCNNNPDAEVGLIQMEQEFTMDALPVDANLIQRVPQIAYPGHQLNPDANGNHTISLPNTGFLGDLDTLDGSAILQGVYQKRVSNKNC
jgi:hypothetical protein